MRHLADRGHIAYLAGGCVRDELLGLTPTDYDVATDAPPDRVRALFRRSDAVGEAFGVVLVHSKVEGVRTSTEVATFREESGYSDNRRPDRVSFSTAEADARRRDFTVNALFLDPFATDSSSAVIDYVGGRRDLERRVLRAVGDPAARLREDHLRALRAVRFTCRLGFALDDATAAAVRDEAAGLEGVSRERIGEEVRKVLAHATRGHAARLLSELGLTGRILAVPAAAGVRWAPAAPGRSVLDALGPEPAGGTPAWGPLAAALRFAAALFAWSIDLGLIDALSVEGGGRIWREALYLSNDEREAYLGIGLHLASLREPASPGSWLRRPVARQKRAAVEPEFRAARWLLHALDRRDGHDRSAGVEARVRELAATPSGLAPRPLIDGNRLIRLGMTPGPHFARILSGVYDAQLEGRIQTIDDAERLASELAATGDV